MFCNDDRSFNSVGIDLKDVILVMGWKIYVLSEVKRGKKRKKLGSVVGPIVCTL